MLPVSYSRPPGAALAVLEDPFEAALDASLDAARQADRRYALALIARLGQLVRRGDSRASAVTIRGSKRLKIDEIFDAGGAILAVDPAAIAGGGDWDLRTVLAELRSLCGPGVRAVDFGAREILAS